MKKAIALLLALILALASLPAFAEASGSVPLPQAGDTVCGFRVTEIRSFDMIGATLVLFEHQNTGAKLMYIANEDTNRAFQLAFPTRPADNTGIPHVFEHATLSGSEKYPSTSLFMNLAYQTYNTYMNAYTMDAMTGYPMASLSEDQLLSLADYYTASCLEPLIMTDESIYRTEAWRYEMTDPDGELSYNGTVYSEMNGAMTLERAALDHANQATFPGASLSYDFGGVPDEIPQMTWEGLKAYHDRYYHPSNCIAILYGSFRDYTRFLQLLDDAFRPYEKSVLPEENLSYTRITEPGISSFAYPAESGSNPDGKSAICYYILCPGLKENPAEERIIDHVCRLLGSSGSALIQNLKKAIPTGGFSVGREVAGPDDAVLFMVTNANPDDAELFRSTVNRSLQETAENGFDPILLDSVSASLRVSNKLALESGDPINSLLMPISYYWAVSGNPFLCVEETEAMENIPAEDADGLLTQAISAWLTDPALYTLTTTYPAPGEKEAHDAALAEKLAGIRDGMNEAERQAIVDATLSEKEESDSSAMVASLKSVTVESLPEEVREYSISDVTGTDGIRRIDATAGVDGIGWAGVYLDMRALPQEDLHYLRLLTGLIGQLDTDAHSKEEISALMDRYLISRSIGILAFDTEAKDDVCSYLCAEWTSLDEDLESGYALLSELLFHTQFSDTQTLSERIAAQKASLRSGFNSAGYNFLLTREMGRTDPYCRFSSFLNGISYYAFLEQVEQQMADHPEEVAARLAAVQGFAANRAGAISAFAGNGTSIEINRTLADAFLSSLPQEQRAYPVYDLPVPEAREAIVIDSNIQFNLASATYAQLGMDPDWSLAAVCTLLQDQLLMPVLRDQMGVYTPMCGTADDIGLYLVTYRDPNVAETFQFYETIPERMAALSLTQDTVDGYIMRVYSSLAMPDGELTGAFSEIVRRISGKPEDERLVRMRALKTVTPETVQDAAGIFSRLLSDGSRGTVGGAGAIGACPDLYDAVLNPFNAVDASQQAFLDVPEESPFYAGVRFAFENGLMAPLSDDRFGAEDQASVGDLLAALYAAVGGTPHAAEEARGWLAGYGLVSESQDLAEGVSEGFLCALLNGGFGAGMSTETPDAAVTRADLAELLRSMFSAPGA